MGRLTSRAFSIVKSGDEICQDKLCYNLDNGHFAIADGVGSSLYPEYWAELLTTHFCSDSGEIATLLDADNWDSWLEPIRGLWLEQVTSRISSLDKNQWSLRNRFVTKEPAASTFVGIVFREEDKSLQWKTIIIGDSCFFHIRDNKILTVEAKKTSLEFDNFPDTFRSYAHQQKERPSYYNGTARSGDVFILATDALSKWILKHYELQNHCGGFLPKISALYRGSLNFVEFVNESRNDNIVSLENDDVALLIIRVHDGNNKKQGASEDYSIESDSGENADNEEDDDIRLNDKSSIHALNNGNGKKSRVVSAQRKSRSRKRCPNIWVLIIPPILILIFLDVLLAMMLFEIWPFN